MEAIYEALRVPQDITFSDDQLSAMKLFLQFEACREDFPTFLLTGTAGTGKTFLIGLMSNYLKRMGYKVTLIAPTGRAAKVMSRKSRQLAYTIHHHIYQVHDYGTGISFERKPNKEKEKTVYIVDEASMIGEHGEDGGHQSLLHDLLQFVWFNNAQRKLIMVGDPVQLPPVKHQESPALDPYRLGQLGNVELFHAHLTDVKRQLTGSGILENAMRIRETYEGTTDELLQVEVGRDVQLIENPWEALETFIGYFEEGNLERVVFITYSNWQAVRVNQAIRQNLFHTNELLVASDVLMVVKNNYAWGDPKKMPFIANGEMGTIRHIYEDTREEIYGLNFIDAEIEFVDSKGEAMLITCKIVLDLLTVKQPQLQREQLYKVTQGRREQYMDLSETKYNEAMRKDPYINALQVKYGYAITGHKSQGGQWENALISFEPDYGNNPQNYLRWTYTVFTRAEERVFLLNCPFVEE